MARSNSSPTIAVFGEFDTAELADAAGRGAEATTRAAATLGRLREVFHGADQIDILSRLAFLCVIGSPDGRAPRREPFVQAHELELLQAIALNSPRVVRRDTAGMPQAVEDLLGLASEHTAAVREMSFGRLGNDAARNRVEAVLDRMRGTTHSVRGPRHACQTRAYCRDLAAAMDGEFETALGFTVTDVVDFLEGFANQASRRLEALQISARRWMRAGDASRMLQLFRADNPGLVDDEVVAGLNSGRIPATQTRAALHALFEEQLRTSSSSSGQAVASAKSGCAKACDASPSGSAMSATTRYRISSWATQSRSGLSSTAADVCIYSARRQRWRTWSS